MKNLNGWVKVTAVILALVIQAMFLGGNAGRRDEAIANLKDGQKEIKEQLSAIEVRINGHFEKHE